MNESSQTAVFLDISAWLTGYDQTRLQATGLTETYLQKLTDNTTATTLKDFYQQAEKIVKLAASDHAQALNETTSTLMHSSNFDATAQKIILMWYTGQWFEDPSKGGEQINAQSYVQSLVWPTAEVHPPGAKQPGFASWAQQPIVISNH